MRNNKKIIIISIVGIVLVCAMLIGLFSLLMPASASKQTKLSTISFETSSGNSGADNYTLHKVVSTDTMDYYTNDDLTVFGISGSALLSNKIVGTKVFKAGTYSADVYSNTIMDYNLFEGALGLYISEENESDTVNDGSDRTYGTMLWSTADNKTFTLTEDTTVVFVISTEPFGDVSSFTNDGSDRIVFRIYWNVN